MPRRCAAFLFLRSLYTSRFVWYNGKNFSYKSGRMDSQLREKTEYALGLIAEGQEAGVDLLYRCMGRTMLFVARGVLHDEATAEDAVQESFLKIVQNIGKYRRGTNGYAWVCRIVRNTALNCARSARGRDWQEPGEFDSAAECGFEEKTENVLLVEQLMAELTAEERDLVYMKYFLDMTVREIGKAKHKSKSYVSKAILRAERSMKEKLDKAWTN